MGGDVDKGVPPLNMVQALRVGFPVALTQSLALVAGNTAILYITVSFCQMIKAWTPACVYITGCAMGIQKWSPSVFKCILIITMGLVVAAAGEIKFNLHGVILQVAAMVFEGLRINLLEARLTSNGYKLNPLSSVQIFAPLGCCLLTVCVMIFDTSAFSWPRIREVGEWTFLVNGLLAFFLNLAIYFAIQKSSGLIFAFAGIAKDIVIILGSCVFMGSALTMVQVVGYTIAICGLQMYGIVCKSPKKFDEGLVSALLSHLVQSMKSTSEDAASLGKNECSPILGKDLEREAAQ